MFFFQVLETENTRPHTRKVRLRTSEVQKTLNMVVNACLVSICMFNWRRLPETICWTCWDDDHAKKEPMFCKHSIVSFMPSLLLNKSLKRYISHLHWLNFQNHGWSNLNQHYQSYHLLPDDPPFWTTAQHPQACTGQRYWELLNAGYLTDFFG